ncbi:flagellar hook-associated protein FlgK [Epibacterium sp. MM17-32]|jgi:flagellar hook-associated protein 1 FlgK|uniref:flagellar hook-associated protein FlgK n=1 Tax=Epibacterium sp. MM17-32 TaxID=2917734 RepID=UPI001EF687B8|nr:flagellar hook-associated protein FlgK [Epibacterium sp. MM17-32]MCG7628191.1 flagellar hook-associated protein FlgK [Epibacterium sp. MM17-32]
MSLSTALNSAMSGITAAGRSTSVVSDNLANALTEGYYRRTLDLSSNGAAGGVSIGSVQRMIDPAIQKSVRAAEANFAATSVTSDFYARISEQVGTVNDGYSVAQRLTDLESALIEATSLPDSDARLNDLSMQAEELAMSIQDAAEGVATLRNKAEDSIVSLVDGLETDLKNLNDMNKKILAAEIRGQDTSGLEDQRDNLIDSINEVIPVQIYQRDNNQTALYTTSGIKLIDGGSVAEFSFDETPLVTPYMTIDNGQLSGLEIDGKSIDTSINGRIGGGSLAAQFHVRDVASVQAQEDLDTMAGDLIERFQDPTVDTTLGATDPGIFTDGGGFYDNTNELGIANRIEINSTIAMSGDAETWRLRDGLNATGIGNKGDTTILNNYGAALEASNTISSAGLGTGDYSAYEIASNLMTNFTQENTWAEQELAFSSAIFSDIQARELEQGVDTDSELQTLMMIETIYAANARMIQAIDEMMQELMRL